MREPLIKKTTEKRNSPGKDPRTFDENNPGGDFGTLETHSHGEYPRTFKEPVQRWRVQKKRKEQKWKKKKKKKDKRKKVKYRRSSWWKKAAGRIASFFVTKLKKKKRKQRKAERVTNVPERDKSWASREDCYFSICLRHRTGCVSTLHQKDCRKGWG